MLSGVSGVHICSNRYETHAGVPVIQFLFSEKMKSCGVHHRLTIRTYLVSICLIISPLIGDVTAVTTESVVGDCEHLNGCNGNGRCDFKTRSCECFDGFGSKRDVTPIDIPDCSLSKSFTFVSLELYFSAFTFAFVVQEYAHQVG